MKAHKLREMRTDELHQEKQNLAEQLFRLRFQKAAGQMEKASKMKLVRHDLARVKTILRERALAGEA